MKKVIYPGSFDPVTLGHLDIILRASKLCDELVVSVGYNINKKGLLKVDKRIEFLKRVTKNIPNVSIDKFDGLLVDYAHELGATAIIKGLRAISDFEYEFQMAMMNQKLQPNIETMFMMTRPQFSFLSSTMVKEVGRLGGDLKEFIPEEVLSDFLKEIDKLED